MKQIACESCGTEISPKAATCPKCGHPNPKAKHLSASTIVGALIGAALLIWYFDYGGLDQQAAKSMSDIENKVAADAVAQYQIAKRQGDPMQICNQAGMVSAAFLQAKDEASYQQWKKTEDADCIAAGMPK